MTDFSIGMSTCAENNLLAAERARSESGANSAADQSRQSLISGYLPGWWSVVVVVVEQRGSVGADVDGRGSSSEASRRVRANQSVQDLSLISEWPVQIEPLPSPGRALK